MAVMTVAYFAAYLYYLIEGRQRMMRSRLREFRARCRMT